MQKRRIHTADRRKNIRMPKVPFTDSNGDIVALNRRYIPDRRLNSLNIKLSLNDS